MRVGLIVNPVAGLGGAAGLKGSDGPDVQAEALRRGAVPRAGERAAAALRALADRRPGVRLSTAGGAMGEDAARAAGLGCEVRYRAAGPSSAADTRAAARALAGVDLLLFAGGDGTARDVLDAAPHGPVLGVPAGVKVYSGCFAISPFAAGTTAAAFTGTTVEAEVVDLDEEAYRTGRVGARLYGTVTVPAAPLRLSGRKTGSSHVDPGSAESIAREVISRMDPEAAYLLGPGGTTQAVGRMLGLDTTPLGVDLVHAGRLLAKDLSEEKIYGLMGCHVTFGVLSVLGGQGFVIGRGNQQLSPRVLARLAGLRILATREKLAALNGRPLLADSGDPATDRALSGHVQVITGHRESAFYRLISASEEP